MPPSISIILDTDIDHIDDALALSVALRSPEINVVGVTTVFRNAPRRALLASKVLKLFGREDVPVFAGCSQPLLPNWDNFPFGQSLGQQFETPLQWNDTRHAVDFVIQTARDFTQRGEQLTIVCIGALTNVAIALHLAPDLVPSIKIHLMGGLWSRAEKEWNIFCDPEAAAMVMGSGVEMSIISVDVTEQVKLTEEENRLFFDSQKAAPRFLGELIKLWGNEVVIHDALTVLSLFSPLVTFEPMRLQVPLSGEGRALTVRIKGHPNALVSTHVKVDEAKELFLERVLSSS